MLLDKTIKIKVDKLDRHALLLHMHCSALPWKAFVKLSLLTIVLHVFLCHHFHFLLSSSLFLLLFFTLFCHHFHFLLSSSLFLLSFPISFVITFTFTFFCQALSSYYCPSHFLLSLLSLSFVKLSLRIVLPTFLLFNNTHWFSHITP